MPPLISVIIPVYNCERYLAEAIQSVLAQTHPTIELLVVDDGSTDDSAAVAKRFSVVQYAFQRQGGPGAARNRGITLASGSFLAFLDADDVWVPGKLTGQLAEFERHHGLDIVFGHVQIFRSPELTGSDGRGRHLGQILPGLCPGAALIRRDSFLRVGLFDTTWVVGEFIDWYAKAVELGLRSITLPEVVMNRRLHADHLGTRERSARRDYARILKASLDRRRQSRTDA